MDLSNAKPIEINDKPLFDSYFKKFPPEISEFTFTNLFIWRKHYDFLFTEFKEHLIIFSTNFFKKVKPSFLNDPGAILFLPPVGNTPNEIVIELFKSFDLMEVHRVPDNITQKIKESIIKNDFKLEIAEDHDNWDYVYEKEAIMNLSGNKHRQNRRWLNKFLESYNYEFNLLSEDWIDKCRELQLEWCIMRGCEEDEGLADEHIAINEALDNYSQLKYKGGIICVDNNCAAYTFGEMLNESTMVVHIEKAHMEYEGSYQAINNFFLKNCCNNANFVNREQDLGVPGLKRAKESYKPIRMVRKSIIYQNNSK